MLVSLTVGKVDAGVTVLLTPDKRLVNQPNALSKLEESAHLTARLDRVPIYPPSPRHLLGQHRRHHRWSEQQQRGDCSARLPYPPRPDLQRFRRFRAHNPRLALPQCHTDVRRP